MDKTKKQKSSKAIFLKQKAAALDGVDLSRKGGIDAHILPLVSYLNHQVAPEFQYSQKNLDKNAYDKDND